MTNLGHNAFFIGVSNCSHPALNEMGTGQVRVHYSISKHPHLGHKLREFSQYPYKERRALKTRAVRNALFAHFTGWLLIEVGQQQQRDAKGQEYLPIPVKRVNPDLNHT